MEGSVITRPIRQSRQEVRQIVICKLDVQARDEVGNVFACGRCLARSPYFRPMGKKDRGIPYAIGGSGVLADNDARRPICRQKAAFRGPYFFGLLVLR